jgi:hypothetical protein
MLAWVVVIGVVCTALPVRVLSRCTDTLNASTSENGNQTVRVCPSTAELGITAARRHHQ